MIIKFTKSAIAIGYAYMENEVLECNAAIAKEFVELGFAIEIEQSEGSLPTDLPARDVLLKSGITTIEALRSIATAEQLIALKGIGKKLAEEILNYLAS